MTSDPAAVDPRKRDYLNKAGSRRMPEPGDTVIDPFDLAFDLGSLFVSTLVPTGGFDVLRFLGHLVGAELWAKASSCPEALRAGPSRLPGERSLLAHQTLPLRPQQVERISDVRLIVQTISHNGVNINGVVRRG